MRLSTSKARGACSSPTARPPASSRSRRGIVDGEAVEITEGLADGSTVITLGLRLAAGRRPDRGCRPGRRARARAQGWRGGRKAAARVASAPAAARSCGNRASRSAETRTHEHPTHRHRTPDHDVHALRGHRAARRDFARPAAGRPDAGRHLPEHHRPRELRRRRPAGDGGAGHPADRAGGERRRRPGADQLHLVGRQLHRPPELRVGHRT